MFKKGVWFLITGTIGAICVLTTLAFSQETMTIKVWDMFGYEGETAAGPAMDKLTAKYEKLYPNVKIKRTFLASWPMRDKVRLAVAAGAEPDMFYTWPAAAVLASLARGGGLYDMTEDAKRLGWFEVLPELEIKRCSYKGKLFGYPSEQDYMLVYYNEEIFDKLGLMEPETYNEFLNICEKLKKTGYIPITFGNRGKWPATNTMSSLLALTAGVKKEEEVFFGEAKWTMKEFVDAGNVFVDWVKKGYFPSGFNGIDYGEASTLFTTGRAAMNITGTWVLQDMARLPQFELGMFMLPKIKSDVPRATMMGEGSQWEISARSLPEVQKEAVKFVDFLMSEENVKTWVEEGYLVPIRKGGLDWGKYDVPKVIKKTFIAGDAMQEVNGYDLHTTVPERVTELLYSELQRMLGQEITPKEALTRIQEEWEEAKKAGELWIP